ncbi:MAG: hypothetical protein Kow0010_05610 [Dehalococcoidia bacterium]
MTAPTAGRVTIEEGVVFGRGGGRELRCDVFTPPGGARNAPAVLLVHGGGWREGDRTQLRGYGILLGREGFVCVASEYRLAPGATWPAQIHDVKAAIRWMRANAGELGINADQIAIEGNSAGGHLALMAAGTPNMPEFEGDGGNPGVGTEVAAVIAFYAPARLDASNQVIRDLLGSASADAASAASPLTHVSPSFPPTMLIHGNRDDVVPVGESFRMYDALDRAGVPVELHIFAGEPHAFDSGSLLGRQSAGLMRAFLARYVAVPQPSA